MEIINIQRSTALEMAPLIRHESYFSALIYFPLYFIHIVRFLFFTLIMINNKFIWFN